MKISPVSFKSTYFINSKSNGTEAYDNALNKISEVSDAAKIYESIKMINGRNYDFVSQANIVANQGYDEFIEKSLLAQKIKFVKKSNKELLSEEAIKKRAVVPNSDYPTPRYLDKPVYVDAKKFDEAFKETAGSGFYIEPYFCMSEAEKEHTDKIMVFMKSGLPIKLPEVVVRNNNGKAEIGFQDGRHRYAIMRDLGFKTIPLAMDKNSFMAACETGLIKEK